MVRLTTIWEDRKSDEQVENDLQLPKYDVSPAGTASRANKVKLQRLKGLVVVLPALVLFYFGLSLLLHRCPEYIQELQTHAARNKSPLGFQCDTHRRIGCRGGYEIDHGDDGSTSITNGTTLARRQSKTKYTFQIPVTAKKYLFNSWGWIDKSTIKVTPFDSAQRLIQVDVQVIKNPKNTAQVFRLPAKEEIYGVGFNSRKLANYKEWPAFDVTVRVPINGNQKQQLGVFESWLSSFDHEFKDMPKQLIFAQVRTSTKNGQVKFDKITAKDLIVYAVNGGVKFDDILTTNVVARTTNGAVKLGKAIMITGNIRTVNGEVSGTAWSTKELAVTTTNGKIQVDFTLIQSATVKLSTTNGKLLAQTRMQNKGTNGGSSRPTYRIHTSNINSPIYLKILEQPTGSGCYVSASSLSAVKVEMPPAFEGKFRLSTPRNQGKVQVKGRSDPAGSGKRRVVKYDRPGSPASGWTGWGGAGGQHSPGEVWLTTKKSQAQLVLN